MRKLLGWILLIIGVPGLTWWASKNHAKDIENKVTQSTQSELANLADMETLTRDLNVEVSGRDIRISGHTLEGSKDDVEAAIEDSFSESLGRRVVDADLTAHESFGPNLVANYDVGKGLDINGSSTPDIDGTGVAGMLGLDNFEGNVSDRGYGEFGAAKGKLAGLKPFLEGPLDTAQITVDDAKVDIKGSTSKTADPETVSAELAGLLGNDASIEITGPQGEPGAFRDNIRNGETEVFSGGIWLPSVNIDVSVANCQQATDDVLANYKIQFVTGSADLDSESNEGIDRVAGVLAACLKDGSVQLEIGGHTDNVGDPISNLKLSQARADSVLAAIQSRGIESSDITAKGYGVTAPIASNDTADGREKNRRTEINWSQK